MIFDGIEIDLDGLRLEPAFVNAHDHLEFALFPRLGNRVYPNATEWARDIYHPDRSPIREHLRVPKTLRLFWGGLRNLIAGATEVWHHNPWHESFETGFPVRVLRRFGWAHSLAFSGDIRERFKTTPPNAPFIIHASEGTDATSTAEIRELSDLGVLGPRTVLVHAVGIDDGGWEVVRRSGASVVWCPRSNLFTLGRTLDPKQLEEKGIRLTIGTDSPLTAGGDLLDEIAESGLKHASRSGDLIATREPGAPPELVIMDGHLRLVSERLARGRVPEGWSQLHIEGRPRLFLPYDIPALIRRTYEALGSDVIRLAGREVLS